MEHFIQDYGLWGLLIISFIGATIIPLSSEIALGAVIAAGVSPVTAVLVATAGNWSGVTFNYFLGRGGVNYFEKFRKKQGRKTKKFQNWIDKYGWLSLLLTWVPFIGDPITIAAGWVKFPFLKFAGIVYTLRLLRYIVVIFITKSIYP